MTDSKKIVLITGAARGLGRAIADYLFDQGYAVFGTSRHANTSTRFPIVKSDVTNEQAVRACVEQVVKEAGRIDVLINNAGLLIYGAVEEISIEEARLQFDTNFFGAAQMIKACLPLMRQQGGGYIVNISSLAALLGIPFWSYYTASKAALEALSTSLRYECRPWKINVSLIEPGDLGTGFTDEAAKLSMTEYEFARTRMVDEARASMASAPPPIIVAKLVDRILRSRTPRARYRIGPDSTLVGLIPYVPASLVEFCTRKYYKQD